MARQTLDYIEDGLIVYVRNPGDITEVVIQNTRLASSGFGDSITVPFRVLKQIVQDLKKSGWPD